MPWRGKKLLTLVFWPGEFHGQRSLAGYSPWGRKESNMTERLSHTHTHKHAHAHTHTHTHVIACTWVALVVKKLTASAEDIRDKV